MIPILLQVLIHFLLESLLIANFVILILVVFIIQRRFMWVLFLCLLWWVIDSFIIKCLRILIILILLLNNLLLICLIFVGRICKQIAILILLLNIRKICMVFINRVLLSLSLIFILVKNHIQDRNQQGKNNTAANKQQNFSNSDLFVYFFLDLVYFLHLLIQVDLVYLSLWLLEMPATININHTEFDLLWIQYSFNIIDCLILLYLILLILLNNWHLKITYKIYNF